MTILGSLASGALTAEGVTVTRPQGRLCQGGPLAQERALLAQESHALCIEGGASLEECYSALTAAPSSLQQYMVYSCLSRYCTHPHIHTVGHVSQGGFSGSKTQGRGSRHCALL